MAELDKIVDQLSKLTVMEASNLAKMLEETWGVSASIPAAASAASQDKSSSSADEEKSEYDVILESIGEKKINVIKEVKAITGLGLKQAKDLVESVPQIMKKAVAKSEAEELKSRLEGVGAKISLK